MELIFKTLQDCVTLTEDWYDVFYQHSKIELCGTGRFKKSLVLTVSKDFHYKLIWVDTINLWRANIKDISNVQNKLLDSA